VFRLRNICFATILLIPGLNAYAVEVKPEINGTYEQSCRDTTNTAPCSIWETNKCGESGTAACTGSTPVPGSFWNGLLDVGTNQSYITIQDIKLKDAAGYGMRVAFNADHITIDNIEIAATGSGNFDLAQEQQQVVIKNSSFHHSSICYFHWRGKANVPTNVAKNCDVDGPSNVELGGLQSWERAFVILSNNDVYDEFIGESVGFYKSVGNGWLVGNRVREGRRNAGFYMENVGEVLIESNIIWDYDNAADPIAGVDSYNAPNPDIKANVLDTSIETNWAGPTTTPRDQLIFRNNMLAAVASCVKIQGKYGAVTIDRKVGGQWYGNTCLTDGTNNIVDVDNGQSGPTHNGQLDIVNNIFYRAGSSACELDATDWTSLNVSNNYWAVTQTNSACSDAGDVIGTPDLVGVAANMIEANYSESVGPVIGDFELKAGDAGLNAGVSIESAVSWLDDVDYTYFSDITSPCAPTAIEWEKQLGHDANCVLRSASPNIGADETN